MVGGGGGGVDSRPSGCVIGMSLALVRSCLGLFPIRTHVPFFHISSYSPIILVSTSSSYFTLTVLMLEVYLWDTHLVPGKNIFEWNLFDFNRRVWPSLFTSVLKIFTIISYYIVLIVMYNWY